MKFTIKELKKLGPCREALTWAKKFKSMEAAWNACEQPRWLFWALERVAPLKKKQSVRLAIEFAKQALPQFVACYPDDRRPKLAIKAAENWLKDPTSAARSAAEISAESARSAARSAAEGAWSAAESAAWSAAESALSAAESTAEGAWSAAESALSAAESARSAQCKIIREIVPYPFKEKRQRKRA